MNNELEPALHRYSPPVISAACQRWWAGIVCLLVWGWSSTSEKVSPMLKP